MEFPAVRAPPLGVAACLFLHFRGPRGGFSCAFFHFDSNFCTARNRKLQQKIVKLFRKFSVNFAKFHYFSIFQHFSSNFAPILMKFSRNFAKYLRNFLKFRNFPNFCGSPTNFPEFRQNFHRILIRIKYD